MAAFSAKAVVDDGNHAEYPCPLHANVQAVLFAIAALIMWCGVGAACMKHYRYARIGLSIGGIVFGNANALLAVLYYVSNSGDWLQCTCNAIVGLLISMTALLHQQHFMIACHMSGIIFTVGVLLSTFALGIIPEGNSIEACIFFCFWVHTVVRRRLVIRNSEKAMKPYIEQYDLAWKQVLKDEHDDLASLQLLVARNKSAKRSQPHNDINTLLRTARELNDWYQNVVKTWAIYCVVEHTNAKLKSKKRALEEM